MPTVNTKNIMVGAGHLYISETEGGPVDQPAFPTAVSPAVPASYKTVLDAPASGFRYVGATSGGVEVAMTQDVGEVEVDQLKDAALIFNTGQSATVSTELAEPTLANLLVSWGLRSSNLTSSTAEGDVLSLEAMPDELVERSIVLVGNAPGNSAAGKRERVYYGRRVINVEAGGHTLSRTDATTLPVTFRLLPDPTQEGAQYGRIVDRTVAV